MSDADLNKAKALAAMFGGVAAIAAAWAASAGYGLAAMCGGVFMIIAGMVLAVQSKGQ